MTNFKTVWEENETAKVIKAFSKWERLNLTIVHGKREKNAEWTYGLPYTDSSDCAMLGNTNVKAILIEDTNFQFEYIAITENDEIIVVCYDKEENEKYIQIG